MAVSEVAALDAGTIIRLGSGILFLALGVVVVVLARRRLGALAFGVHLLAGGGFVVAANLWFDPGSLPLLVMTLAHGGAGLVAALLLPARPTRRERWAIAVAGALAILPASVYYTVTPGALTRWPGAEGVSALLLNVIGTIQGVLVVSTFLVATLRLWAAPRLNQTRALQAAGVALPSGLWLTTGMVDVTGLGTFNGISFAVALVLVVVLALAWLVAAERGGGRLAIGVSWGFVATALATYLVEAIAPGPEIGGDSFGLTGIVRILGWSVAAYAILRADLLGVRLPNLATSRGTIATAVLASFFLVAQVVENFVDARLGLVSGGLVAGAILFAAAPIQRAAERVLEPDAPRAPASVAPGDVASGRAVYREALLLALADGALSAEEEAGLAEIAERLGLGPRAMVQVKHEVEAELAARRGA